MTSHSLTEKEKQQLQELFAKSCNSTLQHDIDYMVKLKSSFFDDLCESDDAEVRKLGEYAKVMRQFIVDCQAGLHTTTTETLHAFTSVLLYLVNPFDLIPDKCPDRGYCDDIYILRLGMAQTGEALHEYAQLKGIDLKKE